ncbi:MAG TPA: hypothetical protein VHI52_22570 [Verrucomicrobiae bacterium]|nr:hypothetical protein [Verrucomicrobiae bacterium]
MFARPDPRIVTIDGIGELQENRRYGWWTGTAKIASAKRSVGVCFKTGERLPGEREASFWRQIAHNWPQFWLVICSDLRQDRKLFFDSPEEADAFFEEVHPTVISFDELPPGDEQWEIEVQPAYSEHLMTLQMRGMKYQSNRLDG